MIFGIGLGVIGYAIFYWGVHHFPGIDGGQRYSLFTVLGIPEAWQMSKGGKVGLTAGGQLTSELTNETQGQNAENSTTPNGLTGGGSNWIGGILSSLNAPGSNNNVNKLNAWNACEGNLSGHSGLGINNPFNTTLDCCGGSSINSAGVKSYPTMTAGIQATVQTLQAARYAAIVTNLQKDGSFQNFAAAVGASGWGTSGTCIAGSSSSVVTA